MDNRIGLVLGLGLTLCAGAASAAGYYNLDQGIESFGSGASMVARPGNASAVYLNPADLAGLGGFDFMVGADYALDYRSHARASAALDPTRPDEITDFEKVTNDLGFGHAPSPNVFWAMVSTVESWGRSAWERAYGGRHVPIRFSRTRALSGTVRFVIRISRFTLVLRLLGSSMRR